MKHIITKTKNVELICSFINTMCLKCTNHLFNIVDVELCFSLINIKQIA